MRFGLAILMLALAGCVGTFSHPKVAPEALVGRPADPGARVGEAKLLLLPPVLHVGELGPGGAFTPRADWTEEAARNVMAALETKLAGRVRLERLDEASLDPAERADYERFATLARAVTISIVNFGTYPTKDDRFDWSVGETGRPLARSRGARYALLVEMEDTRATAGLIAQNMLAAFFAGLTQMPGAVLLHGAHQGRAYLVDLETGRLVWYNWMESGWPWANLRGRSGAEAALALYEQAHGRPDTPVEVWRSTGVVAHRLGRRAAARDALATYLARAPAAADRAVIERMLDDLGRT
ncbi:MAG: hypothetical protein K6T74_07240 [Geminicoccaceae bacterium]|nr:hypothetical protein [Geminicoccaceae bacterium]